MSWPGRASPRVVALVIALVGVPLLASCSGGNHRGTIAPAAATSSVSYGPATLEPFTLPQPIDANGLPAMLSPSLRARFLAQLSSHLHVASEPPHREVALFGTVVSAEPGELVLADQPQRVATTGTELPVPSDSGPGTIATNLRIGFTAATTDLRRVPGGAGGLHPGLYVFVGARVGGDGTLQAQMIGTVARIFGSAEPAGPPASTAAARPTSADLLTSAFEPIGSATGISGQTSQSSDGNTVTLSKTEGLPGRYLKIGPSIKIGTDNLSCSAQAQLEIGLGFGDEYHWPFQLVQDGDEGFEVVPLDKEPTKVYGVLNDLITFSAGEVYDPSEYTVFSQWGFAIGADVGLACQVSIAFFTGQISWDLPLPSINDDFLNVTKKHIPLAGEDPLEVPPSKCPALAAEIGPFTLGLLACEDQTYSGGLFRATLLGPGGTPQGIAAGFAQRQQIAPNTAPHGGQVTIDEWNYSPYRHSTLTAGVLADFSLNKNEESDGEEEPHSGNTYTSNQRQSDQTGPTLADGRYHTGSWQAGQSGTGWHNSDGSDARPPTETEVHEGYSNWVHPDQQGPTYSDGSWQDHNGRWHVLDADGRFRYGSGPADGATANSGTAGEGKDDEGDVTSPGVEADVHGPSLDIGDDQVSPDNASTSSLYMNVPAPATAPTSAPTHVITFEPWTPAPGVPPGPGSGIPEPHLKIAYAAGSCDSGSADDPGRADAYRCTSTGPPPAGQAPSGAPVGSVGDGVPCFLNVIGGDIGSPLLCSADPASGQVVELLLAGATLPTQAVNKNDPSQPAWFLVLANGLQCEFDGYATNHNIYPYDCPGNIGVSLPDRSSSTWTVQEGSHATLQSSEIPPAGPKIAVITAYR